METNKYKGTAVIVTSKFVMPNNKHFNDYINYLDRDEAKKQSDFSLYNNYMSDERKATSLFSEHDDQLDDDKKEKMKEAFKLAESRGSILYQDVVSFDNQWLEDNGIYDRKTKTVDEKRLKDITRIAMKDMMKKSKLDNNTVWSGAIHHNTDNIHIHIATVDLTPPENQRGKRKLKTLEGMRSIYVNKINDRSLEHQMINDIIRKQIVNDKKEKQTFSSIDRSFKKDFMKIYKALPENKRHWNYGYENINHVKPALNKLTKDYIDTHYKNEFKELEKRLEKEVEVLKKTYGEGSNQKYKDYKTNKIEDLYKRMGNAFLSEIREYDNKIKKIEGKTYSSHSSNYNNKIQKMKKNVAFNQLKYGIDRLVHSEINSRKNQSAYERMQQNIERGHSM
jgi:hypothetical protein